MEWFYIYRIIPRPSQLASFERLTVCKQSNWMVGRSGTRLVLCLYLRHTMWCRGVCTKFVFEKSYINYTRCRSAETQIYLPEVQSADLLKCRFAELQFAKVQICKLQVCKTYTIPQICLTATWKRHILTWPLSPTDPQGWTYGRGLVASPWFLADIWQ